MKYFNWKKIIPHAIAIAIFLVISLIYCRPALEGKVLSQHDIIGWKGAVQNSVEHQQKYGHYPLWNTGLFSGMPNYQISIPGKSTLIDFTKYLSLGLPEPINYFFLACICFYILSQALGLNVYISIAGSLAFAYGTYIPNIIAAGHITKMLAVAYMPAMLAGLILLYTQRYWLGLLATALFATLEIGVNHPQITYYFFIVALIMTLSYVVCWVRQRAFKHMLIALLLALLGGAIGVGNYALTFLTTSEYTQYTIRGGKSIERTGDNTLQKVNTKGLDKEYAFSWSYGKAEIVTSMMPNAFGKSSMEHFDENASVVNKLVEKGIPENNAIQLATSLPTYWGGQDSTSGPFYFGVITVLLAVVGFVLTKSHHRWWILAGIIICWAMSWGRYSEGFNSFLLDHLPYYNKFRAPNMIIILPQLLFSIMAVLGLQELMRVQKNGQIKQYIKPVLYAIGGLLGILTLMYVFMDYSSPIDKEISSYFTKLANNDNAFGRDVVNALITDRKKMFGNDLLRSIGFAILLLGLLYTFMRQWLKPIALIVILLVINTADLLWVDSKYLNEENYQEKEEYISENFTLTAADELILKDKDPHYRVYNISPDRFSESRTSYFHRSIGGYHAAKLRVYQDIIENQFSKNPPNTAVLDMLDTKYFLISDPQTKQVQVQQNPNAMGACWLVKNIIWVDGPVAEMNALDSIQPRINAIVDKQFTTQVPQQLTWDTTAFITLKHYNNDTIQYTFNANAPQFAVFSEVYYPKGWNAYIDGKPASYVKVNYVLRGMYIPAGKHDIEFRFEPVFYKIGGRISFISSILLWLVIVITLMLEAIKRKRKV
mgnify:CR=1 FL=1